MNMLRITATVALLASAALADAQPARLNPDVYFSTGYFLMRRLDLKCPEPDPTRAAAMARYQQHFLLGAETFIALVRPGDTEGIAKLRRAAIEGLSPEQNKIADDYLDRFSPERIAQLCDEAPATIDRIITQEQQARAEFRRQNPGLPQ